MSRFQIIVLFLFACLALGLVLLWYYTYLGFQNLATPATPTPPPFAPLTNTPATSSATLSLTALQAQVTALDHRVDVLEDIPSPTPPRTRTATSTLSTTPFQKQVLTLGSANTTKQNWVPTGLEMTINSADYPAPVYAYFEAGLNCSGCIVSARLTNKTTGAIINISELSHDTNTVTWKRSTGFKLHPGNNNYVVELRSSSGEVAFLTSSRIILDIP